MTIKLRKRLFNIRSFRLSNNAKGDTASNRQEKSGDEANEGSKGLDPFFPPPNPSQSPSTQDDTDHNAKRWWNDRKFILELLAFLVLCAYTIFACLQWLQIRYTNDLTARALDGNDKTLAQTTTKMQLQADAMNRVADKAGLQVDKAQSVVDQTARLADETHIVNGNVVRADRPWMGGYFSVSNFTVGSKPTFTFTFINSGKRPAISNTIDMRTAGYVSFPNDPDREYKIDSPPSTIVVVPGGTSVSNVTADSILNQTLWDQIIAGTTTYWAFGKIEYRDLQTNVSYFTHVCFRYFPKFQSATDAGFRNCTEYNDAK